MNDEIAWLITFMCQFYITRHNCLISVVQSPSNNQVSFIFILQLSWQTQSLIKYYKFNVVAMFLKLLNTDNQDLSLRFFQHRTWQDQQSLLKKSSNACLHEGGWEQI